MAHPPSPQPPPKQLVEALAEAAARIQEDLASLAAQWEAHYLRNDPASKLSQAARRLRAFESELQLSQTLVHATDSFCQRSALFALNGPTLEWRAGRNLPPIANVPLASAPAFATVVETKETVVALRTRGELSELLASSFGETAERTATLFPIVTKGRVAGVLYADADDHRIHTSALELLATMAGAVLDGVHAGPRLHSIAGTSESHDVA